MDRLENNKCILDALVASFGDSDRDVITAAIKDAIANDTKLDITKLTKKKVITLPKLDREYKVSGKGRVMRKMSVGSFCKIYNKGTYFLRTVNTAVAVRDGNIIMGVPNNKKGIVESFKIG